MAKERKMNRNATIENIRNSGMIQDLEQFNKEIQGEESEDFITNAAMFCDVEIVYE
jgi:hypothetical protein